MNFFLLSSLLCLIFALATLVFLVRFLSARGARLAGQNERTLSREYRRDYYLPLGKLLHPNELARAQALTGVSAASFARFRRARIQSFRGYLSDLRADFNCMEIRTRYLLLSGTAADSKLVEDLNRTKLGFQSRLLRVEIELALFAWGVGSINVSELVEAIEAFDFVLSPGRQVLLQSTL